jgi:hypothetical protein
MKRALTVILAITAVHFGLMYFTVASTFGHKFSLFGISRPDTWFSKTTECASEVMTQPLGFFLDHLPSYAAPKLETASDRIVGWLLYVLNSVLWGATIWLIWYGFEKYRSHRPQAA